MTKLVDGCVPAFTECPFKEQCSKDMPHFCEHLGTEHKVPYSCAIARSYEITHGYKEDK